VFPKARSLLVLSSALSLQVRNWFQWRLVGFQACVPPLSRYKFSLVTPSSIHPASSSRTYASSNSLNRRSLSIAAAILDHIGQGIRAVHHAG